MSFTDVCDEGPLRGTSWLDCSWTRPHRHGLIWKQAKRSNQSKRAAETMELLRLDKRSLVRSMELARPIEASEQQKENSSDNELQRAEGSCRIVVGGSEKGTRVMELYQKSPIRALFPRTGDGRSREAVLVNTSGGVAGGDSLQFTVSALSGASIAVTTQAAEKIYRALDQSARISTKLNVGNEAKLAWLPQETIVFNHARLSRRTEIEILPGSELLALECLVLGRAARGEKLSAGAIIDTWQVSKNGRLLWGDTFRLTDAVFSHLSRKALLGDSTAIATLLYFGPDLEEWLQLIRAQSVSLDCQCGGTLVGEIVVARFAAKSSFELKTALRNFLAELGQRNASGPFRVPKMWAC